MKLLKLSAALISICLFASCASKSKTEAPAPTVAKTETAPSKPVETKATDSKKAAKKVKAAAADASTKSNAAEITCKSGADERKVAIQAKDAGCELMYTKAGETKSIASQITGNEKCEQVAAQVKANLTAAGFTCQ